MRECYVSFASALEVRDFVNIATKQLFSIRVERGNMQANAKSILSLCSLGFHCPLRVVIPEQADGTEFFSAVRSYVVA